MYYSITFVNEAGVRKNTWDDWHIVPSSRPVIAPPEPKTSYVDIPGGNGSIDFTTALVPYPLFKDREGTLEFIVLNGYNIWHELYSDIMTFLNGQKVKLYLEETPDYYYEGRITIDEWNSKDHPRSKIKMKYKVSPFQIGNDKIIKTLTVNGNATMTILASELDTAPVSPSFQAEPAGGGTQLNPSYSINSVDFDVNGINSGFIGGAYGNGITVLIREGDTDNICTLKDGAWSIFSFNGLNARSVIVYTGGLFVIMVNSFKVMVSSDGVTWNTTTLQNFNNPTTVASNNNGLYIMTSPRSSNLLATSTDGITWKDKVTSGGNAIMYLTYAFSKFIGMHIDASGSSAAYTLYSSTDGEIWEQLTGTGLENDQLSQIPLFHNAVTCNGTLFVPLLDEGLTTPASLLYSNDGLTWGIRQISSDPTSGALTSLIQHGEYYIAANVESTTENIHVSKDCIEWTALYDANISMAYPLVNGLSEPICINSMDTEQPPKYLNITNDQSISSEIRVFYQSFSFNHVVPEYYPMKYPDITFYGKPSYELQFAGKGTVTVEIEKRRY